MSVNYSVIQELVQKPFSTLPLADTQSIIEKGRPRPVISSLISKHKDKTSEYTRHFNVSSYERISWLCGCSVSNKLYCWPCLLFSTDRSSNWVSNGFTNLNNLSLSAGKHEKSLSHIRSFIALNNFGKARMDHLLSEHQKLNDSVHNDNVRKNRKILTTLIDAVCYLIQQELPFREHNEADPSTDRGNYVELLNLLRFYDPLLDSHLNSATVFRGTSPAVQNNIIYAINEVIDNWIFSEIQKSKFIAVVLDETSDVISKSQLSTVVRYVDENGQAQERFRCFTDVSSDRSAERLYHYVIQELKSLYVEHKIVALTYDGAAVMSSEVSDLQSRMQEVYPEAGFVHCASRSLNLVLQQAATNIKECRVFFQTLRSFASFFSKSTKRAQSLTNFIDNKVPISPPTRWNFFSKVVNTVKEYQSSLLDFFEDIIENSEDWDNDAVMSAQGYILFLKSFRTTFLLGVFSKIFSQTDVVNSILQRKDLDTAYCKQKIEEVKGVFLVQRENFTKLWEEVSESPFCEVSFRQRTDFGECRRLYYEIMDLIGEQLEVRFRGLDRFGFVSLLNSDKFQEFEKTFPEQSLLSLQHSYGKHFDILRLKNELTAVYSTEEFQNKPVFEISRYIKSNNLDVGLPEVYKLAILILTVPSTKSSAERSFSALKRIKTYCRSTKGHERVNALAKISIEKEVLLYLKNREDFHENIIKKFIEQERRMEFIYK